MRIDIVHQRDPDSECGIEVYVDGQPVDVNLWGFDPGAGYEMAEFDAMRDADIASAPEFLRPVLAKAYADMRPSYERWSC